MEKVAWLVIEVVTSLVADADSALAGGISEAAGCAQRAVAGDAHCKLC